MSVFRLLLAVFQSFAGFGRSKTPPVCSTPTEGNAILLGKSKDYRMFRSMSISYRGSRLFTVCQRRRGDNKNTISVVEGVGHWGLRGKLFKNAVFSFLVGNATTINTKHRQVTDLDVTDLGFRGPGFRSARQVLCGDASRLFLRHFSKHLSSVSGRTELCHEVRNPGPQKPQIIRNENHHLALFENSECAKCIVRNSVVIVQVPRLFKLIMEITRRNLCRYLTCYGKQIILA